MDSFQARDEIFQMLKDVWEARSAEVSPAGEVALMIWQGQEPEVPPPLDQPYGRATVRHATGRQATLAGADTTRRYRRDGVVIVQCFGPGGIGLTVAETLANIVLGAFEGKASPGGIWFRNCRINEVDVKDGRYQVNAVAEFQYDEVK